MVIKIKNLIREIKPSLSISGIGNNTDLINQGILDSLEITRLILLLEEKHGFNIDEYEKEFKHFTLSNIEKFLQ